MSTLSAVLPLAGTDLVQPVAPGWQLILAALAAIALIVVLITVVKLHPFLALILGGLTVGILAGEDVSRRADSRSRPASAPPPPVSAP